MSNQVTPTKGNLLSIKKSLKLAKLGFELMDRKKNILVKEITTLLKKSYNIQRDIDINYRRAYSSLQTANITLGICNELAYVVPIENSINLSHRSVMGIEIPVVSMETPKKDLKVPFGMYNSNSEMDKAYLCFKKVKKFTVQLAEVENSIYLLSIAIKKVKKRANSLKNILIPKFENISNKITKSLEEKEREEFVRLKILKQK
ncbi:MAG: V-type ATP synthase subunit D [Candidatus Paraimprobicoccus trichonymphae]|uniref:V-type ATP synthase subunit D n=1 Tax=Candidatus Paraimprobicoccus trichonymphae TaxID=3033793 RepID=A0AA48HZK9_9FIRM|nr:MAG: V-type ATP synthase subunit D [Candidatus Paraimprobicoccus trichonymphae]